MSIETFYEVMRRQGISRRSFLKFCSLTAASLGLAPTMAPKIAEAMETYLWCASAPYISN